MHAGLRGIEVGFERWKPSHGSKCRARDNTSSAWVRSFPPPFQLPPGLASVGIATASIARGHTEISAVTTGVIRSRGPDRFEFLLPQLFEYKAEQYPRILHIIRTRAISPPRFPDGESGKIPGGLMSTLRSRPAVS